MTKFHYIVRDKLGNTVEGFIESESEDIIIRKLIHDGYAILDIKKIKPPAVDFISSIKAKFGWDQPSLTELSILTRQLHSMAKTGVPIVQAILLTAESANNEVLQWTLRKVMHSVESGQTLANSMKQFPKIFPPMMITLVNVGENTGKLEEVFAQLTNYFEREIETKRQIKEAIRYPLLVLIVIIAAIIIINIFVIPSFETLFKRFSSDLPWQTQILLNTSNFLINYWPLLIIFFIILFLIIRSYLITDIGKLQWDKFKLNLWFIGSVLKKALLARFLRAFALSMRTGVPVLDSITLIANTTDNTYVGSKILTMRENIEHGESLTNAAKASGMFTPLVLQMMAVGEQSGELDNLLDEVGTYYEQEVNYELKRLGAAIEPILISIIAVMVLILALGVFLPMWDLSNVMMKES